MYEVTASGVDEDEDVLLKFPPVHDTLEASKMNPRLSRYPRASSVAWLLGLLDWPSTQGSNVGRVAWLYLSSGPTGRRGMTES